MYTFKNYFVFYSESKIIVTLKCKVKYQSEHLPVFSIFMMFYISHVQEKNDAIKVIIIKVIIIIIIIIGTKFSRLFIGVTNFYPKTSTGHLDFYMSQFFILHVISSRMIYYIFQNKKLKKHIGPPCKKKKEIMRKYTMWII